MKVHIYTDMQYTPVEDHKENTSHYMPRAKAQRILKSLGFIKVSANFDQYDIQELRKIKSKLPKKWVSNFNLWLDYNQNG